MESEYVACLAAVLEAIWLRRFFQHLEVMALANEAVKIYSDSMTTLTYAKDPKYHGRIKHINIRFHYIRDVVARGKLILQHISTSKMVVDPLTKATSRNVFQTHVKSLRLHRI